MSHLSVARLTLVLLAIAGALAPTAQAQYAIPSDNPFAGAAGARGEIYVYGMRNPYRWSFDRATGDMWIGDVGGSAAGNDYEEIDHLTRAQEPGANLGWNCLSGNATESGCTPSNYFGPVLTYPSGADVVIGGYVVHDPDLPGFAGSYLYGRFNTGIYRLGTAAAIRPVTALSGFGEDSEGRLFVTSLTGPVYRLGQSGTTLTATSIGSFDQPVAVAGVPGDGSRQFVVEKPGRVRLRAGSQVTEFLDIAGLVRDVGGEEGLLAFAAAPDYATSGRVFAYYVDNGGDLQLDEFRRSSSGPDRSDASTRRPILTIQHDAADNHNGGQLLFGPDGYLYLSTGDGGVQGDPEGDAQSLGSLLGKVLRIDVGAAAGGGSGGGTTPVDATAPRLRTLVKRRQRVLRLRGAVAYARCSENCSLAAGGYLRIGQRRYKLRRVTTLAQTDRRKRLKVVLPKRARRALRKALGHRRRPRVQLNLRARDGAGNRSALAQRTVRIRR